ncbi:hypothetical protein PIB30_067014, partial [Stylosanthes scabra]|nr:hypothetical protein [Stylosanthes scabra]
IRSTKLPQSEHLINVTHDISTCFRKTNLYQIQKRKNKHNLPQMQCPGFENEDCSQTEFGA